MPRGEMPLEVGEQGGYYTLKDPNTGYYLKGDNSAFTFNEPDYKSVYPETDGHYELNLNVDIAGSTRLVTVETSMTPDFSNPYVFSGSTYKGGNADYMTYVSDLDNNKIEFNYWSSSNGWLEPIDTKDVVFADWEFTGGAFRYAFEISSTLPEECLFTMSYDEDYEEWVVSSKPHQDKQLYFNKDGKFGFYAKGSSYTPVMVFRDNDLPLASNPTSVSVSFVTYETEDGPVPMNTVSVGEEFPWTSALIVKANYSGGASKVIPVGGYTLKQAPDTSVIGSATGIISYGQNGHQIDKEFTVLVKGNTQAFDVVCKDPILVGETYQAHLDHYTPPEGEPITWSVSNETLASIDQNGNVTGLAPGYVDVIATSFDGTLSDFEHIQIYQQVEYVTLNKHNITLDAGQTEQLTATVLPEDASNPRVEYSSSNPNVAFVDQNTGLVTAVSKGTATITCSAQNHPEDNFDTCEVTVKDAPIVHVTGISLNCTQKDIEVKGTFKLTATIEPSNATVKGVTWSSNHENIATVDQNGNVKGVAKGECIITATTADGNKTATCTINVKNSTEVVPVSSISLNKTNLSLDVNSTDNLVLTVNPGDADYDSVSWTSSDETVVKFESRNKTQATIKGLKEGTATITVECGGKTATCLVTVGGGDPDIAVTGVELNETTKELNVDETYQLIANVLPGNASNQKVTWSSSNSDVAVVSSYGKVTAKADGEATITVTTEDGSFTATCKIVVGNGAVKPNNDSNTAVVAAIIAVPSVAVVGTGCGIGIPAAVKASKVRKLAKIKK